MVTKKIIKREQGHIIMKIKFIMQENFKREYSVFTENIQNSGKKEKKN